MPVKAIPKHPTENPHVPKGRYTARVHDMEVRHYGKDEDNLMIRIVLHLEVEDHYLATHIYLPKNDYQRSLRRYHYFCSAVNSFPESILEAPSWMRGLRLEVWIEPIDAQVSGMGRWYSDVMSFEPLEHNE